jgi:hypothetical protein
LNDYRNRTSGYAGGRWPFHVNTDDITRIYFRDNERKWHTVLWEHAASLDMPLSEEAFDLSRRRAAAKYTYPSAKLAIADLLERWNMGLGLDRTERRMALRLARAQAAIDLPEAIDGHVVSDLPSVRKVLEHIPTTAHDRSREPCDDDDDRDLDPDGRFILPSLRLRLGLLARRPTRMVASRWTCMPVSITPKPAHLQGHCSQGLASVTERA